VEQEQAQSHKTVDGDDEEVSAAALPVGIGW
jgi:hypothetical protein